jgi:hypothetical protein
MFGNAFCVLYGALIIETFLEIIWNDLQNFTSSQLFFSVLKVHL